jgi:protocatechuate 3,4-dioxygenase beta subunit
MKYLYAKMTFRIVFISFLAFLLIGCGESGSPGGRSGPGATAVISLSVNSDWEAKVDTGGQQTVESCELTETGGYVCVTQNTAIFESVPSLPADGKSSAPITIELTDSDGNPVMQGTKVKLHTTSGTFINGKKDYTISLNESASSLKTSIIAGTVAGRLEITAVSNKITQTTIMTFTEEISKTAVFITMGTSANTVNSDNSDNAIITTVVLDANHAPVEGIPVSFKTVGGDGIGGAGQISASSLLTDANGEAEIAFSSGVGDKRNQIVTIEASVVGLESKQIPIQVTGSYLTLSAEGETIVELGGKSYFNVTAMDSGNAPVFDVPVKFSLAPESAGVAVFDSMTGMTDINGKVRMGMTATGIGSVIANVESLGVQGSLAFTVEDPNKVFRIIEPTEDILSLTTNINQTVRVLATGHQEIVFAATIGTWDGTEKRTIKKQVVNGEATAIFNSSDAGTTTIQVYPTDNPAITDTAKIAVSAAAHEASKIFFQTSATVVAPSTTDVKNSVILIAKVSNSKNQVVKDAPVLFSIMSPTGGGEYVSPAIAFSDASGIATSTFTSGSLVAGADGVQVRAELIDVDDAFDLVSIIISGKAASLNIGRSTVVLTDNEETTYKLPMSVLVSDANGSPVQKSVVSLNLWPSQYRIGYWVPTRNENTDCIPVIEGTRPNEDVNKNLILDEGEDLNQNGQLTPPSAAAGAVPTTVVTDETGVANFYLIYTKAAACWTVDEVTASTVVSGTETLSTYQFVLPWARTDATQCLLPDSPYFFENLDEVASVIISAGITEIIADGNTTSVIRATVLDNNNNPMKNELVEFSATLGSFIEGSTALTNEAGIAKITLQSGTSVGTSVVTANADGFTAQVEISMTASEPDSISIVAIPDPVVPEGTVIMIASLFDEYGNPVEGESLNFAIVENSTGGSLDEISSSTDVNGQAFITYTAGSIAGTDRIKVTLNNNQSISILYDIDVEAGAFVLGSITLTPGDESIPADGVSSTTITAVITDSAGNPVPQGTGVRFMTNLGTIPNTGGSLCTVVEYQTADDSGTVVVSLISGTQAGTATVIVTCLGVSQSISVNFTAVEIPVSDGLYLTTTKTTILTNNADFTTITAHVLDDNHVPIEGAIVNFSSTGAQISAATVVTDANGEASIILTSGPDKTNHTVTVAAEVDNETASVPITLTGTVISITPSVQQLTIPTSLPVPYPVPQSEEGASQELVVSVVDAGGNPVYNAPISIENITPAFSDFILRREGVEIPLTTVLRTDYAGEVTIELVAQSTATPVDTLIDGVEVDGMVLDFTGVGTSARGVYIIGDPDDIFNIVSLEIGVDELEIPYSAPADGTPVVITLHAGGLVGPAPGPADVVVFATSFGTWDGGGTLVTEPLTVDNDDISRSLSSLVAGTATVQVYDQSNLGTMDFVQISFYNPAATACDIVIDASQTNILPSNETSQYSLVIQATVYDSVYSPVQNAVVEFWMENTTGGGEFLTPVIATTNFAGIVETIFTSGSLGTGSAPGSAVEVFARVWAPACLPGYAEDSVGIVISGAVANVSIGLGTAITSDYDETIYLLPVSVLVADTNGNPVPGAFVSLALKPSRYATGYWYDDEDLGWISIGDNPCVDGPGTYALGTESDAPFIFVNEDLNNNAILDNFEDELDRYTIPTLIYPVPPFQALPDYFPGYAAGDFVPGLGNGVLNPGQSVAGAIPTSVTTDENGVITFTHTFQKEYAHWVEAEITATAMVFGTEYITKARNWLPVSAEEVDLVAQAFGGSPFNNLPCGTVP